MPRFSDVFVYETESGMVFTGCRLIKQVGKFNVHDVIDTVYLDLPGMFLMFTRDGVVSGPYLLTTH